MFFKNIWQKWKKRPTIIAIRNRIEIWASHTTIIVTTITTAIFFYLLNFTYIKGKENLPKQAKNILIYSNHRTMFDSFLVAASLFPTPILSFRRTPYSFAAGENYFANRVISFILKMLKTLPVKPGRKDVEILKTFPKLLKKDTIHIFYQGTRSKDLNIIRNGIAWTVNQVGKDLKVIPAYIEGMDTIFAGPGVKGFKKWWPVRFPFFRQLSVTYGPAIDFFELLKIENLDEKIIKMNEMMVATMKKMESQSQQKCESKN